MVLHLIRALFLFVVLATTISFALQKELAEHGTHYLLIPSFAALALVLLDMFWRKKRLQVLSGLFFGLIAGMCIAYMCTLAVDAVVSLFPVPAKVAYPGPNPALRLARSAESQPASSAEREKVMRQRMEIQEKWDADKEAYDAYALHTKTVQLMKLLVGAAIVFLCVSFVMQTKDDFRFVIPYVEFAKEAKGAKPLLLDTSVIIDGRIADIVETRILESVLLVPRFVLAELQTIADSDDKLKRNRGRRGLDILNRLQGSDKIEIQIIDPHVPAVEEAPDVDAKLVALAQHLPARVATNDYNLNKIAQIRNVEVININDLANAMKPIVLPGERMSVKIIKPGESPGQGVGYLDDGTMVVVEQGRDHVSREVALTVTSVLQTSAGRMIFGRLDAEKTLPPKERKT